MAHKILQIVLIVALIHALSGAPQAPPKELAPPHPADATGVTEKATEKATEKSTEMVDKPREARAATDDETTVKTLADTPIPAAVNKDSTDGTASTGKKEIVRTVRGADEHDDDDDEEEEDDSYTHSYTKMPPKQEKSHEEESDEDSEEDSKEKSKEDSEELPTKESEYEYHQEHDRHSRQAGGAVPPIPSSSSSEESKETKGVTQTTA